MRRSNLNTHLDIATLEGPVYILYYYKHRWKADKKSL